MIIQQALLPHKHVSFSQSTLAVAGRIRRLLSQPRGIDELWSIINHNAEEWPQKPSFTQMILAIDVLFAIKQVDATADGHIFRIDKGGRL